MNKVYCRVEIITPEIAKVYLEHNETNRKINKGQVAFYARMMREGEWELNGESLIFSINGNLLDGQHRLMACIEANVPFQTVVIKGISDDAMFSIDKGRKRTDADTFKIEEINNSTIISASIRLFCIMNRTKLSSLSRDGKSAINKVSTQELLAIYKTNPEYWQNEFSFASACYGRCRLMSKSEIISIVAFLNQALEYDIEYVHDFFNQLFFEEVTENKTLALFRRKIINDCMKAGNLRMTNLYKTQLLIKAWNAFKQGVELKMLSWSKIKEGELFFE